MIPVELCPRKRHYRCNLCCVANAGEMPNSEQIDFCVLPGPGKIHLVRAEKAIHPRSEHQCVNHIYAVYNYSLEIKDDWWGLPLLCN